MTKLIVLLLVFLVPVAVHGLMKEEHVPSVEAVSRTEDVHLNIIFFLCSSSPFALRTVWRRLGGI